MAGLIKWSDKQIKKLDTKDMALTKIAVMFFMLTVAKIWPAILTLDWYYYAIPWMLLAIRPISKFLKK